MRKSKFTESQILAMLGEGEAGLAVAGTAYLRHQVAAPLHETTYFL
jgi:hypothetical protein